MKRLVLVFALPLLLVVSACNSGSEEGIIMAAGSYSDLAVVISDARSEPMAGRFAQQVNQTKVFVIREEPLFNTEIMPPDNLDLVRRYKNVIILLRIGDGGPVEKEVRSRVSKESWQRLTGGNAGMVRLNDPWSTYQTVLVVAATDRNTLGSFLRNQADRIRLIFEDSSRDRILRRFRYTGLNTHLMNAYRDQFGFSLEIPREFEQNQFKPDGFPGLELLQTSPSRGITISWRTEREDPAADLSDQDLLLEMRREMGREMHSEEIVPESLVWTRTELGDREAVKLEGAWTSTRFEGGGAFWCYFVADPVGGRILCLDLLAYAPGMEKMAMFRTLDAIAHTLKFNE